MTCMLRFAFLSRPESLNTGTYTEGGLLPQSAVKLVLEIHVKESRSLFKLEVSRKTSFLNYFQSLATL